MTPYESMPWNGGPTSPSGRSPARRHQVTLLRAALWERARHALRRGARPHPLRMRSTTGWRSLNGVTRQYQMLIAPYDRPLGGRYPQIAEAESVFRGLRK